jgi:hypothetical protein
MIVKLFSLLSSGRSQHLDSRNICLEGLRKTARMSTQIAGLGLMIRPVVVSECDGNNG